MPPAHGTSYPRLASRGNPRRRTRITDLIQFTDMRLSMSRSNDSLDIHVFISLSKPCIDTAGQSDRPAPSRPSLSPHRAPHLGLFFLDCALKEPLELLYQGTRRDEAGSLEISCRLDSLHLPQHPPYIFKKHPGAFDHQPVLINEMERFAYLYRFCVPNPIDRRIVSRYVVDIANSYHVEIACRSPNDTIDTMPPPFVVAPANITTKSTPTDSENWRRQALRE